jgi:hypothetical protein
MSGGGETERRMPMGGESERRVAPVVGGDAERRMPVCVTLDEVVDAAADEEMAEADEESRDERAAMLDRVWWKSPAVTTADVFRPRGIGRALAPSTGGDDGGEAVVASRDRGDNARGGDGGAPTKAAGPAGPTARIMGESRSWPKEQRNNAPSKRGEWVDKVASSE